MRTRRNKYRSAEYNYGSQAYKLSDDFDYEVHRRRKRKVSKKKSVKSMGLRKSKAQQQTLLYRIKNFKLDFYFMRIGFGVFVLFIYAMMFVNILAVRSDQNNNIARLREELTAVEENNVYLESQLAKNIDIEKVESIASSKLGMQKPSNHQIVYIDVPKQSYTVQYSQNNSTETFSLLKVFEIFTKE